MFTSLRLKESGSIVTIAYKDSCAISFAKFSNNRTDSRKIQ